jgi:hypothetical protein
MKRYIMSGIDCGLVVVDNGDLVKYDDAAAEIEKLKCCGNCKHYVFDNYGDCYCEIDYFAGAEPHKKCLLNENKWELYQQ